MSSVCVVDLHVLYCTKCCDLLLCCTAAHVAASNLIGSKRERINSKILKGTIKVKFTLEQATKAQRRSKGIALLFP